MNKRKVLSYFIFVVIVFNLSQINVKALDEDKLDNNNIQNVDNAIVGDINNDSLVDYDDAKTIVDDILAEKEFNEINDVNNDNEVNINDATSIIYKEKTNEWENNDELTDKLSTELKKEKETNYQEDEVNIDLYINGFKKNTINGIEGNVEYNKDKLSFLGIYNLNKKIEYGDINEKNKFVYLLNTVLKCL